MATQYSNKPIVTNGLVYALDFGNQKSYVSGSSSAFNLVYSTTTSSLNSYNSGQKGVVIGNSYQFNVPGDAYVSSSYFLTQALTFLDTASEYTVTVVVEPKAGNYSGEPRYLASNLTATGRTWGITYGTSGFTQYGINDGNTSIYSRQYPVGTSRQHVTYRYKSGSFDFFVNGVPVSASAINPSTFFRYQYGGGLTIGSPLDYLSPTPNGYAFSGSLGLFYVYNRALSSNEIYSNYLIAAQRYGLPTPAKPYSLDENAYLFLQSAGITDPIITSSINTFVLGLKSASLWDKMIAIYPFVGTGSVGVNLTGSHRWNLKEPSLVTYPLSFTGSWNGSVSGSTPSGSNTNITAGGTTPLTYYPNYSTSSAHISILSYDTPTSSSFLAGTGIDTETAVSTLAGDYGTPAAAYSVRKVRTAYSGALVDVRRSIDNVTSSIGYVSNGDLDTGSLSTFVNAVGEFSPGNYSGLAAAYSLRKVSASYSGNAIDVRRSDNVTSSIGFDAAGNLNTGSLLSFAYTENKLLYSNTLNNAAWSNAFGRLTITTASAIAPDGTNTGILLSGSYQASPNSLALGQVPVGSTSLRYTSVLYVSQSTSDYVYLRPGDNTACVYRFSTGVFTNVGPFVATLASESAANGWIKLTATTPANENYVNYYIGPTDNATGNYGNPVSPGAVYVWGAQLNSGSTALPYIQTTTAATTSSYLTTYVTQWYDQSGNNKHATQTTASIQPLIVSSGSIILNNGKPCLDARNRTSTPTGSVFFNIPSTPIQTLFGVLQPTTIDYINYYAWGANQGFWIHGNALATNMGLGGFDSTNTGFDGSGSLTQQLVYKNIRSSKLYVSKNGATETDLGTFNPITITQILGRQDSSYQFALNGYAQELLLYNSDQSANKPLIENNINNYYSIYTGSNNGFVARWYDQSGNNRHASQTATGSQPVIVESGSIYTLSGKPAISSSRKQLNLASTATFTDFSFFTVTKKANSTGAQGVLFSSNTFGDGGGDNLDSEGTPVIVNLGSNLIAKSLGNSFNFDGTAHHLAYYQRVGSTAVGGYNGLVTGSASGISTANVQINSILAYTPSPGYTYVGLAQELIFYSNSLASSRQSVEYGINNYYNIYPQTSSFTTSSFTIKATPTGITGAINNQPLNGISSTGPVGFITVSRTGSNALTIARNGVTSSFTVPASGALSTGIYLGASNYNGITVGSSPLGISFASVGVGLTGNDLNNYYSLVDKLQFNLGRQRLLDLYPGAYLGYSFRKLTNTYTGSSFIVQRSSDNATASIGFTPSGDLDTGSLLSFVGSGTGYLFKWFNQVGSIDITYNNVGTMYTVVQSGVLNTVNGKPCIVGNSSGVEYRYGDSMSTTLFTGTTAISVFINSFPAGTNTYGHPLQLRMSGLINHLPYQNYIYENIGVNTRQSWEQYPGLVYYNTLYTIIGNGTTSKYYVNNIEKLSTTYGSTWTGSAVVFSNSDEIDGRLTEVVVYKSDQTNNRIGIQNNINNYYQIY